MNTRSTSKSGNMSDDPVMMTLKNIQDQISNMNSSIVSLTSQVSKLQSDIEIIKDLRESVEFTQAGLTEVENRVSSIQDSVYNQTVRLDMIEQKLENSYKESKLYKEKQLRQDIYTPAVRI